MNVITWIYDSVIWQSRECSEGLPRGCHSKITCGRKDPVTDLSVFVTDCKTESSVQSTGDHLYCLNWPATDGHLKEKKRETGAPILQWLLPWEGEEKSCTTDACLFLPPPPLSSIGEDKPGHRLKKTLSIKSQLTVSLQAQGNKGLLCSGDNSGVCAFQLQSPKRGSARLMLWGFSQKRILFATVV